MLLFVLVIMHAPTTSTIVSLFKCKDVFGYSHPFNKLDMNVECRTGRWWSNVVLAVLFIAGYTIFSPSPAIILFRTRRLKGEALKACFNIDVEEVALINTDQRYE
mmetsp:Transcript_34262/g.73980  ORF Transcript_34262/g.73980 Transcript_34262/m.73980 type:complete len:105 (-) Transcript_34262:1269-1583(-)